MFRTINFRMGVHASIPFYADMIRTKSIDVNGTGMIISVDGLTPIQCAIALILNDIKMFIMSENNISVDESMFMDELIDQLVLSARDGVETGITINEDIVEQIGMIMNAYQTSPDLLIEEAKTTLMRNDMILRAHNRTQVIPTIRLEEINNDLYIHVANGIEIGPVRKVLKEINNAMEFDMSNRIVHIKEYDPLLIGDIDGREIDARIHVPFDIALAVKIIEDDSGKLNLVIYAQDDVETILTHPVIIATLDPKKIGELDPYAVPDATSDE